MTSKWLFDITFKNPYVSIMARKPFTFRLSDDLHQSLTALSKTVDRSMNDLVSDAVMRFVSIETELAARDVEATLAKLRAYRAADPRFEKAIDAYVDAELGQGDSLEGEVYETEGTVRSKVRDLLAEA